MALSRRVGTFNVYNLVRGNHPYYNAGRRYSPDQYATKTAWIGRQLDRMEADLVGFQEVFHADALDLALSKSERLSAATRFLVGVDEAESPAMNAGIAVASTLPIELVGAITTFPDEAILNDPQLKVSITTFSRPVLKARVELFPGVEAIVFVAHLKSKRHTLLEGESSANPVHRALGAARSLVRRATEAAALRALIVQEIQNTSTPVIVLGDLNDADRSVTTQIIAGDPPFFRLSREKKEPMWDVLLYSAQEIQSRQSTGDFYYTHIYNSFHESLDHILVSEEFYARNPDRIAELDSVRLFNDHLIDETQTFDSTPLTASDHAQIVGRIRLKS